MGTATRADAAPVWHRRRVRIYDREAPLGYLLLAPTLVVLGIFLLYPFLFGIWLSITDSELGNLGQFIGLGNYRFELRNTDGVFYGAVVNTFLYTGITTVFKLGLGLAMALLLNQAFPFRRFVRAALLLPYIIPTVLSYEAWRWMFDPSFSLSGPTSGAYPGAPSAWAPPSRWCSSRCSRSWSPVCSSCFGGPSRWPLWRGSKQASRGPAASSATSLSAVRSASTFHCSPCWS